MAKIEKLKKDPEWAKTRRNAKYGFRTMKVGDLKRFSVDEQGCKDIKSFRALVWNRSRQLGYELICRELEDGTFEVYRRA